MRRMRARYAGKCSKCSGRISVGDRIVFLGEKNAQHSRCFDGGNDPQPKQPNVEMPSDFPTPVKPAQITPSDRVFSVDWSDLKQKLLGAFQGNFEAFPKHRSHVQSKLVNPDQHWQGYTGDDVRRWLEKGYETDAIKNLGSYDPPLRQKRRLLYVEEGDEFHYDLAASGDERFMSTFTKRERIPGVKISVAVGFTAYVPAKVVTEYAAWVCKAIYSIIGIGIDPEISVTSPVYGMVSDMPNTRHETRIRVKKEGEVIDFNSFSAMFSPANHRSIVFCARYLHCEVMGKRISNGHGRSNSQGWAVRWDREEGRMVISCDSDASTFPAESMESQLRSALQEMSSQ